MQERPAAERLGHPDAGGGLLDARRKVALLVLHAPGQRRVARAEASGQPHDRQRHRADDDAERCVGHDQQRHHDDVLHDVDDEEDRAEPEEPPDRRQVGGRPRQQLARLPLVVEGDRQPLKVAVEVVADVGLDPEYGDRLHVSTDRDQRHLDDAEAEREQEHRHEGGPVVMGDRPIDDSADHQRHGGRRDDHAERGDEHDPHLPPVGHEVGPEPEQ